MKRQSGYTLIELLIVTAIISTLAAAAIPQFYPFKTRAYDADAKSNLHNVFQSCKGFWTFNSSNSPCLVSIVSNNEYGFVQSAAVEVTIESTTNNTEYDFYATSSHIWSSNIFAIDYRGVITNTTGGGGNNANAGGGNNGGGNGNNGGGCSDEAKGKGKGANLGDIAQGGCA